MLTILAYFVAGFCTAEFMHAVRPGLLCFEVNYLAKINPSRREPKRIMTHQTAILPLSTKNIQQLKAPLSHRLVQHLVQTLCYAQSERLIFTSSFSYLSSSFSIRFPIEISFISCSKFLKSDF